MFVVPRRALHACVLVVAFLCSSLGDTLICRGLCEELAWLRDPGVDRWPSSMSVPIKSLIHCLDLTQDTEAQVQAPVFDIAEEAADV